ncbi:MAG TPA: AraC family transcriptional regulator [Chitinophagaceae bacterium]|nr:AraC family transcriptional regulator [Chitinophagaceae bacterium]
MNVQYESIQEDAGSSFRTVHQKIFVEKSSCRYHCHPEYELVCTVSGKGTRHVGLHTSNYENGDLLLIGPNLPHAITAMNSKIIFEQVIVQFKKEVFNSLPSTTPELKSIHLLLAKSVCGISFDVITKERVMSKMVTLAELPPFDRFVELTKVLHELATSSAYQLLNSRVTLPSAGGANSRLQNIFKYVEQNFQEEISSRKAADMAFLTVPAFCAYFKKNMNTTFTNYINQYRIEQACNMLQDGKSVHEVCYESGFKSLQNFTKVFKNIVNKTPSEFKKRFAFAS